MSKIIHAGLSEAEIESLIKDAELNASKDAEFKESVELRNQADHIVHRLNSEKEQYDTALFEKTMQEVEPMLKSEDKETLKSAIDKLSKLEESRKQASQQEETEQDQEQTSNAQADDIVDAEFEEVKE